MKKTHRLFLLLLAAAVALPLAGCSVGIIKDTTFSSFTTASSSYRHETYASIDVDTGYNPDFVTTVTLNGSKAEISGTGASVADGYLTISSSGSFLLSGSFSGQIIIDANPVADVHLFFDNLTVTSAISAPLYVKNARKTVITLLPDTQNNLYAPSSYNYVDENDESDACIYTRSDLTINGEGALLVHDQYNRAIFAKNFIIVSGDVRINAKNYAIYALETVTISGGNTVINAHYNAVRADGGNGGIYLEGGSIDLTCGYLAFEAYNSFYASNCTVAYNAGRLFNARDDDVHEDCFTRK